MIHALDIAWLVHGYSMLAGRFFDGTEATL
jgi:hypothetical protein